MWGLRHNLGSDICSHYYQSPFEKVKQMDVNAIILATSELYIASQEKSEVEEALRFALDHLRTAKLHIELPEGKRVCPGCDDVHDKFLLACPQCGYDMTR